MIKIIWAAIGAMLVFIVGFGYAAKDVVNNVLPGVFMATPGATVTKTIAATKGFFNISTAGITGLKFYATDTTNAAKIARYTVDPITFATMSTAQGKYTQVPVRPNTFTYSASDTIWCGPDTKYITFSNGSTNSVVTTNFTIQVMKPTR